MYASCLIYSPVAYHGSQECYFREFDMYLEMFEIEFVYLNPLKTEFLLNTSNI
jgi:hypothetical protein